MTMHPPVSDSRRDLGRFGVFLLRGMAPRTAWWLAHRGALRRHDYRGVPFAVLESAWRADPSWVDLDIRDGRVHSRTLGMDLVAHDPVAADYRAVCALRTKGFTVERQADGLRLRHARWTFSLRNAEHLNMAREIFIDECYALSTSRPAVVIDIGANIGLASLYFAAQPRVERVYSFEPFPATYALLEGNVAANPELARKIALAAIGLADKDATLAVDYDPAWSGSMSTTGVGAWRPRSGGATESTTIRLEPASRHVASIRSRHPGVPLVAKIDCEGSEYPILQELDQTGLLPSLDVVLMEWHQRQPDELLQRLERHGFMAQARPLAPDRTLGLITAWRAPYSS